MDRPVGPESPPGTARAPERTPIVGQHSTLVPLTTKHAPSLFSHVAGPEREASWTYLSLDSPPDLGTFEPYVAQWAASTDPFYYAVMGGKDGKEALGMMSYLSIVPEHRRIEIGWVMLGDKLKRTRIATESFYGMMKHAFDDLGYLRVEWKCHSLNKASWSAAERLGFTYEGTFRQHIIVKGRRRDSAYFSVIKEEWPAVKKGLETWLDDSNFDGEGKQKRGLRECREG
ncbi:acetyltransferase [Sarocladium strictum]